jgi:hypothetical protein
MDQLDLREFGRLEAKVEQLETMVSDQGKKIDALLELANKSRGGFWAGMTIASFLGGFASWVFSNFKGTSP